VAFPEKLLNRDEDAVLDLRPHWVVLAPAGLALAGAVIVGIMAIANGWPANAGYVIGVSILVAVVYAAVKYAVWATTNFVITSDRVITREGIIAKRGMEIPLEKINTVHFSQSVMERLLGSGDLAIESAGESGRQEFSNVRKPNSVQQEIYRQIELAQDRRDRQMGRAVAPSAGHGDSIPAQIAQLNDLRQQGIISAAEFAQKKAELLDRM